MTSYGLTTEALGPRPDPREPESNLTPGILFAGRYRLESLLGEGGFGAVYRARDERLERSVALKIVHKVRGNKGGALDPLLAEARTVARLDHPHIVLVFDAGVEEGTPWIASRLVAGTSLKEALHDRGPLGRDEALRLLLLAASALSHAHARGVVHRDIKPANLLLETRAGSDHLWVTDFGIAKLLRGVAESTGRLIGTPAYMAPEQVTGKRVDERTDVFSLGCVAAEILTGKRLVDGASVAEIVHAVVHQTPSLIAVEEKAGAETAEVIRRCLAKSPADRWQSMDELANALGAQLTGSSERKSRRRAGWWPFRRRDQVSWSLPVVAEGVRKRYGFGRSVLNGVDLSIERGSVYALLGRNGCGKTTFLRTLLGIYRRDAGRVALFGRDPQGGNPDILARIGFVPDTIALDESMRVREALDLIADFYPSSWDRPWCHHLLSRYDLPLEEKIRNLSRGMQTKVSLVLALAHRPELLVLDDPTLGLDAIVLAELVETLEDVVRQEGVTALLASHNYEELDHVATHVGLFQNGRIEMSDSLEKLRRRVREVSLTFPADVPDLRTVAGFRVRKSEGRHVSGWVTGGPETVEELRALAPADLSERPATLREIFVGILR